MTRPASLRDFFTKTMTVTRPCAVSIMIWAFAGLVASVALLRAELLHLKNPDSSLGCDINPLVGCSSSVDSWQAHLLFSLPNALFGTLAFTSFLTLGVVALSTRRLPLWIMRACLWALLAASLVVVFFVYHSLTTFRALCPYCLVTWICTIFSIFEVLGALCRENHLFLPTGLQRLFWRERYLLSGLTLAILLLICGFSLADRLALII